MNRRPNLSGDQLKFITEDILNHFDILLEKSNGCDTSKLTIGACIIEKILYDISKNNSRRAAEILNSAVLHGVEKLLSDRENNARH